MRYTHSFTLTQLRARRLGALALGPAFSPRRRQRRARHPDAGFRDRPHRCRRRVRTT